MSTKPSSLQVEIETKLQSEGVGPSTLQSILERILEQTDCVVGTLHKLDSVSGMLVLQASQGIPAPLMDKVQRIPLGKGMAGLAAERRIPIQVCNLQTDTSGVAKPGAKATGVEGSIAVPMLVEGQLRGVLGVAKAEAYEFSGPEQLFLLQLGQSIGRFLSE